MTTATMDDKALLAVPQQPPSPPASLMVEVARKHGVSPLRQMREMLRLNFGPGRLLLHEYYSMGLYDPAIPFADKRRYVGVRGNWKLNEALSPTKLLTMHHFVANKVMYTSLIRQLGFATTETQAVVSTTRHFGALPTLGSAEAVARFLRAEARFPIFGKPQAYSGSFGSVLLEARDGEALVLGNGRRVSVEGFAREIMEDYGGGYLLQSALAQHPDMEAATGRAVGSVRIVTVRAEATPEVLYALWKIPAPEAMSDNFWQDGSMIAPVDAITGEVGQARAGTGLRARDLEAHPVTGHALTGLQLPDWAAARDLVEKAHALFPDFGVIGWDVAITPEGPAIIECNDNPFHTLYQLAFCRGIRNDAFAPVFARVAERSRKMLEERMARQKARDAKHKRKG